MMQIRFVQTLSEMSSYFLERTFELLTKFIIICTNINKTSFIHNYILHLWWYESELNSNYCYYGLKLVFGAIKIIH